MITKDWRLLPDNIDVFDFKDDGGWRWCQGKAGASIMCFCDPEHPNETVVYPLPEWLNSIIKNERQAAIDEAHVDLTNSLFDNVDMPSPAVREESKEWQMS